MDLNNEIQNILLELSKNIVVHKITETNLIFEIDYDKYTKELIDLFTRFRG